MLERDHSCRIPLSQRESHTNKRKPILESHADSVIAEGLMCHVLVLDITEAMQVMQPLFEGLETVDACDGTDK